MGLWLNFLAILEFVTGGCRRVQWESWEKIDHMQWSLQVTYLRISKWISPAIPALLQEVIVGFETAHSLRRCLLGRIGEKNWHQPQEPSRFFLVNLLQSPGVENNNEDWEGSSATPSDLADELFTGFEDGARYLAYLKDHSTDPTCWVAGISVYFRTAIFQYQYPRVCSGRVCLQGGAACPGGGKTHEKTRQ